MPGSGSVHAAECFSGHFIGGDFGISQNLSGSLCDKWEEFNAKFIPVFLAVQPDKTKIAAGLACGSLWVIGRGIENGDIVLCPDGSGRYHVGEVIGDYSYCPGQVLPHRRPVKWLDTYIDRTDMSIGLKGSSGAYSAVVNLSRSGHSVELDKLVAGIEPGVTLAGEQIENLAEFAMEKHLEEFLIKNWSQTELGQEFDIYADENGHLVGQQYQTDTGPLDILAVSKDKKRLLVVELKKGLASDVVVGQILRYMGFVQAVIAEEGQTVCGAIIALEDDKGIRRALSMTPAIVFYRYEISFKLVKA